MEFNDDDTEEERTLKLQVLEYYNARLDERIRRKKFVIERGLLDLKKIQRQERKRSKEEREIINAMKPFARFSEKKEHERRVNSLLKEYQLRVLIGQLKYFREQGLTTLDGIETFIEEKKKEGKFDENKDARTLDFVKKQREHSKTVTAIKSRTRRDPNETIEISNAAGFSQLCEEEKDILVKIKMMPENYNKLKKQFIDRSNGKGAVEEEFVYEASDKAGDSVNPQQSIGKHIIYQKA